LSVSSWSSFLASFYGPPPSGSECLSNWVFVPCSATRGMEPSFQMTRVYHRSERVPEGA